MVIKLMAAFFSTASLAGIFHVPKKFLPYVGGIGTVGWWVYLIAMDLQQGKVYSSFYASVAVAALSQAASRRYKTPVTIFLVSGILPLVPGAGMYHIVYSILFNQSSDAAFYFFETLQIAGMIALAIFLVDTCFRKKQQI